MIHTASNPFPLPLIVHVSKVTRAKPLSTYHMTLSAYHRFVFSSPAFQTIM